MPLYDRRMKRAYPPLKDDSQIYSGEPQTKKFLLQNKAPTENKVDYLLVHRTRYIGTKFEVRSFNTT